MTFGQIWYAFEKYCRAVGAPADLSTEKDNSETRFQFLIVTQTHSGWNVPLLKDNFLQYAKDIVEANGSLKEMLSEK